MPEKIMTVNEVAEFFNIKPVTVRRKTERGELPGFRIGNQWRFRESDIEKFIDNQVSQKLFAMKAKTLWDDIQTEVDKSEYTAEDVPELVRQVREKYREKEHISLQGITSGSKVTDKDFDEAKQIMGIF